MPADDGADVWVFGYGSLMWRPGFEPVESRTALLRGYHRSLCIYSTRYRGTPDRPGLVLGLDRGGACRGIAFRIAAAQTRQVLAYLDEREMGQDDTVYLRRLLNIRLDDGRQVTAVTYVADRNGARYTGRLGFENMATLVRAGSGMMGTAHDYLSQTLERMAALGLHGGPLRHVLEAASVGRDPAPAADMVDGTTTHPESATDLPSGAGSGNHV
ncbi:gamma-glutamylcyclotransferase [Tistrella bauzanensis]|uniref:glutathione-specific gamma-glutamylcyclotransferase n=1 Tax=Tistrella arctica TaxID=3133430 RepID=A0ABU9YKG9_9PROT